MFKNGVLWLCPLTRTTIAPAFSTTNSRWSALGASVTYVG